MTDTDNLPAWRKKFLATRMTFESILFEKELMQPQKEKLSVGLLVLGGIWLFYSLLLAQWALRRGYFFGHADAESFGAVLRYAAYLKSQGFWALVKPELTGGALNPPLYYLAYVPVLIYVTTDLNLALILVNSFFLLIIALAIFLAVRRSRPNLAGWLGAAFALALPFVQETARRPTPDLALMALAAAMYCAYIRSDEFEHPKWTLVFALSLSLGFYAHKGFWIYALPMLPFIGAGLASPLSREEIFKGFLVGMVINIPWYLFLLAAIAAGFVPLMGPYHGFWHYFGLGASAAGLPLFILGAAALAWMYFSVFMPYDKKSIVAAWCWVPYLLLTWAVRGSSRELLYPALFPFAVALPVMTPHQARKFLLAGVLALGAINQCGFVRPITMGGYQLVGLPLPPAGDYRAKEIMELVRANAPAGGGLVSVYGGDSMFNADSLRFFQGRKGAELKFADDPDCPACAAVLVARLPRYGEAQSRSAQDFAGLKDALWFPPLFAKKGEVTLADTSKVEVYARQPSAVKFLEEGTYDVKNLKFGPVNIAAASLTLKDFDPATGAYGKAILFAPYASALGGDIYGLTLDISGLSAAGPALDPFVPAGMTSVRVRSAKISAYAVERFLAERFKFLSEVKVSLDNTLALSALAGGRQLDVEFALSVPGGGTLEARPVSFSFGPLALPSYVLKLFTFRLDFSDNPYGLRLKSVTMDSQMMTLN
jgi:hypothetical protein